MSTVQYSVEHGRPVSCLSVGTIAVPGPCLSSSTVISPSIPHQSVRPELSVWELTDKYGASMVETSSRQYQYQIVKYKSLPEQSNNENQSDCKWTPGSFLKLFSWSLLFQLFLLLLYNSAADLPPHPNPQDLQIRFPQDVAAGRDKRQIQTSFNRRAPGRDVQQGCEITGYQTAEREICEEIVERICMVGKLNILRDCRI